MWKQLRNRRDGFTLVEMLLVVVIITTLAAMVIPRFAGRAQEAKIAAANADMNQAEGVHEVAAYSGYGVGGNWL